MGFLHFYRATFFLVAILTGGFGCDTQAAPDIVTNEGFFSVSTNEKSLHIEYAHPEGATILVDLERVRVGLGDGALVPYDDWAIKVDDHDGYRLYSEGTKLVDRPEWRDEAVRMKQAPGPIKTARRQMLIDIKEVLAPKGYEKEWKYLREKVFSSMAHADQIEDQLSALQKKGTTYNLVGTRKQAVKPDKTGGRRHLGGSGSSGGTIKEKESDRYVNNNFIYKQVLELWSQPWKSKTHHSATRTFTYARQKCGAGDPSAECVLHLLHVADGKNHGAGPGEEEMVHYETCSPDVEIDGWYQSANECEGWWGFVHTCNDDTAGQINNAFGIWTEHRCWGKRREVRPWCQRHW
jgi:hypothetical protein